MIYDRCGPVGRGPHGHGGKLDSATKSAAARLLMGCRGHPVDTSVEPGMLMAKYNYHDFDLYRHGIVHDCISDPVTVDHGACVVHACILRLK